MSERWVMIDEQYRGPDTSGNGGYVCGVVAAQMDGIATVRLRRPPPLDTPLSVVVTDDGVALQDGDEVIATARLAELDVEPPASPGLPAAEEAAKSYVGFEKHWFPGCFVCGPDREAGDGLRIFAGPVAGADLHAAPWTPSVGFARDDGIVRDEFVWAALDCPGVFAAGLGSDRGAVLGELCARIDAPVRAGAPHVVVGWSIGADGRKHHVGTALYDAAGTPLAVARATWIEIDTQP